MQKWNVCYNDEKLEPIHWNVGEPMEWSQSAMHVVLVVNLNVGCICEILFKYTCGV